MPGTAGCDGGAKDSPVAPGSQPGSVPSRAAEPPASGGETLGSPAGVCSG